MPNISVALGIVISARAGYHHTEGAMTATSTAALRQIQDRVDAWRPRDVPGASLMRQAAVAIVFRAHPQTAAPEVLFIRRAEHPSDPWSGHMAFPGGRVDPEDASPLAAAVREAHEEIDLDLGAWGEHLGRLSHLMARSHARIMPMVITPHVFTLRQTPPLTPDPREIQEALWIPLAWLADPENRSTHTLRHVAGIPSRWPCLRYEGRVIWGLTFSMLSELLECLDGLRPGA